MKQKQAVLSLSGGMDSSTVLLHLLANNYKVTCLSFFYGQKHSVELERAQELVDYLNSNSETHDGVSGNKHNFEPITYQTIKLDGLSQLLNSSLVEGGEEVPEGHYESDNMLSTVVPNRNKIFSSIIQAVALSIANETGDEVKIAMGIHAGDHEVYPDCRKEFRDADYKAFLEGNWEGHKVKSYTPYIETDKFGILQDGEQCCKLLGLDFDEVYKRTNTSYKPIFIGSVDGNDGSMRGEWYSDYKSASSVERVEAFIKLGRPDPVSYANEEGPIDWKTVKLHVEQQLYEWASNKEIN